MKSGHVYVHFFSWIIWLIIASCFWEQTLVFLEFHTRVWRGEEAEQTTDYSAGVQ